MAYFKGGRDQFSFFWLPSKSIQYMTQRTLPLNKKFSLQGTGSKRTRRTFGRLYGHFFSDKCFRKFSKLFDKV